MFNINPLTINVFHHIETSQLICSVDQFTGFSMMGTLVVNGFNFAPNIFTDFRKSASLGYN